MDNQLRMTFVIPTFNRPRMLREAVDSCLGQTVAAEVIVVDHGSSEETQRVCESLPSAVTVIRREKDSGPIFSWLDGVLHASTDYINLHFDDDLKHPKFAEECLKLMRPNVGMVFTQARIIDASGTPSSLLLFRNWFPESGVYPSADLSPYFRKTLVSPCAVVYRRQHLLDALYVGRLPNQTFDYHGVGPDLYLQLLAQLNYPAIGYVSEELTYFRAHSKSITIDAKASGRSREFALAYDEVRLAILDVRVGRLVRKLRFHSGFRFGLRVKRFLRKRLGKAVRRYAVTFRHIFAVVANERRPNQ